MELIHVGAHFHPHVGGVERHMMRVTQCLASRGHEVTIVAGDHLGTLPAEEHMGDVRVLRFPATRASWRMRLWFLRHAPLMRAADVIHLHTPYLFGHLAWALVPRRKRIYTAHGWGGRCPIPERDKRQARRCCARVAKRVCVGHFVDKWYGTRSDMVTYGAVDVPEGPLPAKHPRQVCMLGRLAADTGVTTFAEGLRRLAGRGGESIRVVVCGDGPQAAEVHRLLDHPRLTVECLGFVDDPGPMIGASLVTLTSGYLGILEAMVAESAVIAVADNAVKDDYLGLSPMAEFMTIVRSPDDVVAAVDERLSEDATSPHRVAARDFASRQTWDHLVDGYERLYAQL